MNYDVELIREKSYKPTFWSGGMATELITYPVDSDYASRNFLWRLGIAKIDIPESTFSNLTNVSRKFMVTEGKITLDHENKYRKLLKTFEQDSFMGDWKTKTYGKASVFNLMTRENYNGELVHLNITPRKKCVFKYQVPLDKELIAICFYVVSGSFKFTINNKIFKANTNDLLLLKSLNLSSIHEFLLSSNSLEITNIIASVIYSQ
ncbi:environmental stress-induced protein Ves [Clostridium beijerinckii]|uniref:HutD family protein n=1 Tax=Clostridium beijerinckii TaxID=1520 RepID=UPI00156F0B48|nr:HutD family protein [Clostridium beijerinckii]NRT32549.1 environmental stress-induced protein Ves [Clostridium beijerinckii]NRT48023.1 environmental stress-induced protein Ves [Clostridium beijerinckii]NRZ23680.1 environmental stress-induced protein Ves [Clostridium beijerinckii]